MLESHTENALATWTAGQCAFTIEYSPGVIDDIRLAVVDAFFSLPRGGAEIGGILLGRNIGRRVTITDYVPLDCEHATGPSFVLSPKDHAKLAEMLALARGNPSGSQPVGWYHSHTRSEIHLSSADLDIHRRYFPEPWQVALVLKPHTFQPTRAGFFFREADGSIHATASYQEFVPEALAVRPPADPSAVRTSPRSPQSDAAGAVAIPAKLQPETRAALHRLEVPSRTPSTEMSPPETQLETQPAGMPLEEPDRIQRSQNATIEHSTEVAAPSRNPHPATRPRNKSRVFFIAVGWTFSIAVMFILGTLVNNRAFQERSAGVLNAISGAPAVNSLASPTSQAAIPPSLALHAKRQNGDLELNWSRESALIASATSGVISIRDGESKRQIALDSTQVRGGSLLYSPTSDQILMQLTVTAPAGTVTESVMVILPKVGVPRTYPLPPSNPASGSMVQTQPPADSVPLAKASKPFKEPAAAKATLSTPLPIPADSPAVRLKLDPAAALAPGLVSQTVVPPPPTPAPRPATPLSLSQQPPSRQPGSIVITYQPAIAISRSAPVFPPELQALAVTRKVIEVKVNIDKSGRVTKAEAIPQKNVSQFLINSAVNAAHSWRFEPARRNDEPVASETLLQFVFGH